ncbi:ABC transporter ATP-binding protein [Candidatus Viridilinea mediisalina]|uniref:ABC transporter ATP-binding protein n=1 Tax=Candidatus Viridilinea mediisalina TaxID=2024553 RepID=A0A2A6RDK0_9CHLR|nr:ABC transporter ATP-binding protein [Candidatus Viridilinea mediisalina]PDW00170.1 ABC transporter ATP-binding protein [Candidatus Viridilinea mediisalina]
MATHAVIETNYLTRRFGVVTAVDQLDLTIYSGEIFGFLGHNGSGKTTTIRLLNGVLNPTIGSSLVLGMNPQTQGSALRQRTGVLTEVPALEGRLTGRENLSIYALLFGVPRHMTSERVALLLDLFDLSERADDLVSTYSKGMQQRLALARTLLHKPELLFLDEPTSGLDPVAIRQVHALITRLSREEGRSVVLCTHNLVEAQQICDRVAILEHGKVVALGTPAALRRELQQAQRLDLEVAPDCSTTTLACLEHQFGLSVAQQADGQIMVSGLERDVIPDIIAKLSALGVRIYRAQPLEPSLEDVYFALHQCA